MKGAPTRYIFLFLLCILCLSIFLMASVPPVDRDALTQHLAVPKLYVQHGGIYELPDIITSYYPELLDLIYCIPLMFNNDIFPKYIHFAFALFTALILFNYTKEKIDINYALFSVLLFLSLPVIIKLSITIYVDLGLIFFSTASLFCLLKWHETNYNFYWFLLSGIFCGLALSTKYNGLVTLFLLTLFAPIIYLKGLKSIPSNQLKAAWYALMFFFISVVIFSPWLIRNYVWTNNPVFPLYSNIFQSEAENNDNVASKPSMNHFLIRKYVFKEAWWETLLIPVRIFFQGEDDNPALFDGRLNPLILILPIFAFIRLKDAKYKQNSFHKKILFSFSFLYVLIVFFHQDMRVRWIGPALPPLVILSAYGLRNLISLFSFRSTKNTNFDKNYYIYTPIILMVVTFMLSQNGVYLCRLFNIVDPLPYLTKHVTREFYIEKFRPEFAALNYSNTNLNNGTKILALFLGNRRYYSDHEITFEIETFKNIVKTSETNEEILSQLKDCNYTELILNYEKIDHWISTNFSDREKKMIEDFFNLSVYRLFNKGGYGLYHLR